MAGREAQAAYVARQRETNGPAFLARQAELQRAWAKRNREKSAAHCKVYRAIRSGKLVRPDQCERCEKQCKPEASHDDYAKPLEVEWLCRPCHARKDYGHE
jgi:hypothetical protein